MSVQEDPFFSAGGDPWLAGNGALATCPSKGVGSKGRGCGSGYGKGKAGTQNSPGHSRGGKSDKAAASRAAREKQTTQQTNWHVPELFNAQDPTASSAASGASAPTRGRGRDLVRPAWRQSTGLAQENPQGANYADREQTTQMADLVVSEFPGAQDPMASSPASGGSAPSRGRGRGAGTGWAQENPGIPPEDPVEEQVVEKVEDVMASSMPTAPSMGVPVEACVTTSPVPPSQTLAQENPLATVPVVAHMAPMSASAAGPALESIRQEILARRDVGVPLWGLEVVAPRGTVCQGPGAWLCCHAEEILIAVYARDDLVFVVAHCRQECPCGWVLAGDLELASYHEFLVRLRPGEQPDKPLGLLWSESLAAGGPILVVDVRPGSLFDEWNCRCRCTAPRDQLLHGDAISWANDCSRPDDILRVLQSVDDPTAGARPLTLRLRILRARSFLMSEMGLNLRQVLQRTKVPGSTPTVPLSAGAAQLADPWHSTGVVDPWMRPRDAGHASLGTPQAAAPTSKPPNSRADPWEAAHASYSWVAAPHQATPCLAEPLVAGPSAAAADPWAHPSPAPPHAAEPNDAKPCPAESRTVESSADARIYATVNRYIEGRVVPNAAAPNPSQVELSESEPDHGIEQTCGDSGINFICKAWAEHQIDKLAKRVLMPKIDPCAALEILNNCKTPKLMQEKAIAMLGDNELVRNFAADLWRKLRTPAGQRMHSEFDGLGAPGAGSTEPGAEEAAADADRAGVGQEAPWADFDRYQ